jgi:succinyl-diaminopimelate desuccinylase
MNEESVLIRIGEYEGEMVSFTKELVSIPTINPPGSDYDKVVRLLESRLKMFGLETKIITCGSYPKKRRSLIARWNNGKERTLHLNAHYDVVPVTSGWTRDPFRPVTEDGKLFGRGVGDMKAGITMIVYAVKSIMDCGLVPECNIEMSFTPDEEIGGEAGVGYLVKNNLIKADCAIVTEPTRKNTVYFAHKGALWLGVRIKGRPSHSSRPYMGDNAFVKMAKLVTVLENDAKLLSGKKTRLDCLNEEDSHPSMVLGGIFSGGSKINTVPDIAEFTIDRRILPEESIAEVKTGLEKRIRELSHDVEISVMNVAEPAVSNRQSRIATCLAKSIKELTGEDAKLVMGNGFMDMRFFVNRRGIPCVAFGIESKNSHGDDEHIKIKDMVECTKILGKAILKY